jgi:hypothetical protein
VSSALAFIIAFANVAQPTPAPIDPVLPKELTEIVKRATDAELDEKRGTNNAIEILNAERAKRSDPRQQLALDLRAAAIGLRERFLISQEFPIEMRYQQAVSTFARLDLADPGLLEWQERMFSRLPEVKKKLGKRGTWKLRAAILSRSSAIDRDAVARAFNDALTQVGAKLELVPAKEAPLVIVVGAQDAPDRNREKPAVKVTCELQSIKDGKVAWKNGFFRVDEAPDANVALKSALAWIGRVGARDLYFRWLGEQGIPVLLQQGPIGKGAVVVDEHGHDVPPMTQKR